MVLVMKAKALIFYVVLLFHLFNIIFKVFYVKKKRNGDVLMGIFYSKKTAIKSCTKV